MQIDITSELVFKTARSGGKGGQNVNKVETMVIAVWNIANSFLLNEDQKNLLSEKLANKINKEGELLVKSQEGRSQLANKETATRKINLLINNALIKKKQRLKTKPTKTSVEKRLQSKKIDAQKKQLRKKDFL